MMNRFTKTVNAFMLLMFAGAVSSVSSYTCHAVEVDAGTSADVPVKVIVKEDDKDKNKKDEGKKDSENDKREIGGEGSGSSWNENGGKTERVPIQSGDDSQFDTFLLTGSFAAAGFLILSCDIAMRNRRCETCDRASDLPRNRF